MPADANRNRTIQRLAQQLRELQHGGHAETADRSLSTGLPPLDDLLPDGGLRPGSLVEWLSPAEGGGAGTLSFLVAGQLMQAGGACLVIDRGRRFSPPAMGFSTAALHRTVFVHPASDADALWALEQSLRCPGVAVVVCRLGRLQSHAYRRLQLAAETGGGIGLLQREATYRSQPSWADVRLLVEPAPVGWAVPTATSENRAIGGHSPPYGLRLEQLPRRGSIPQPRVASRASAPWVDDSQFPSNPNGVAQSLSGGGRCGTFSGFTFRSRPETQGAQRNRTRTPPRTSSSKSMRFGRGREDEHEDEYEGANFHGRRLRLEVTHCRGRAAGGVVELEIDHETGAVRLAPPLAVATDSLRATGA